MNRDENDIEQENNNDVRDDLVHKGGQAAATYFGGAAGKKIYDAASNTELGQKIEKSISNRLPSVGSGYDMPGMNHNNMGSRLDGLENNDKLEGNSKKQKSSQNGSESEGDDKSSSNTNSDDGTNNENDNKETSSSEDNLLKKFKRLPQPIKLIIYMCSGFFLLVLFIILFASITNITTSVISEKLYESLTSIGSNVSDFFDDASNYFSSIEDSKIEKAEKAYYKKLQDVYEEFKTKYGVEIDTTLITATLFYGRTIADYGNEEGIEDVENVDSTTEDKMYEDDTVEFYKLAKRHVRTLAKYMLVQQTTFSACVDTKEEEIHEVKPYSAKDVAANWTTISTWHFGDQRSWNSRNIFYYTEKQTKTYTKADGTSNTIDWCMFEDVDKQLNQYYEEDKAIYRDRVEKYNTCVSNAKQACKSSCIGCIAAPTADCPTCIDCSQMYACHATCNSANYDDVCASEKAAMEEAEKIYRENWTNHGLYDDDGFKACVTTEKWGEVQKYDDTDRYMNYPFDLQLVEKAEIPNFLHHYENMIYRDQKINCSADPAISYVYTMDNSEEGVYYYKLMENTPAGILDFKLDDSFIERYYPDLIVTTSEETIKKSVKNVVDGIFLLYYTVANREYKYCYTPSNTSTTESTGVSGGSSSNIDTTTQASFYNSIVHDVINDMENTGILASVTMAQASLESGNGRSSLAKNYNNYYGMTISDCSIKNPNTTETTLLKAGQDGNGCTGNAYWNGDAVWMCNNGKDCHWYKVYDSFANSTHDHSRELSNSLYSCQGITNPRETLECLQNRKDGKSYSTSPTYIEDILAMIEEDNLTQYDIGEWNGETITDYSGNGLGTICFTSSMDRDLALGNEISNGEGTITGVINGVRTQLYGTPEYNMFWGSNNNIFHASGYDRECTWYAHGRGLEILTSNGMSLAQARQYMNPMHGDARKWFGQNKYFSSSTNVNEPKVGAIIVWSNGSRAGHVAIIERIHYDSSGKAVSVDISHGGQSVCQEKNGSKVCGFDYANYSMDWVASHSTYRFTGYVYLLG